MNTLYNDKLLGKDFNAGRACNDNVQMANATDNEHILRCFYR